MLYGILHWSIVKPTKRKEKNAFILLSCIFANSLRLRKTFKIYSLTVTDSLFWKCAVMDHEGLPLIFMKYKLIWTILRTLTGVSDTVKANLMCFQHVFDVSYSP